MADPFPNLPEDRSEKNALPVIIDDDQSTQITGRLTEEVRNKITPEQKAYIKEYMTSMRYGVLGVSALTCRDQECAYFSKCPLVIAEIPRPVSQDCPIEAGLQQTWLNEFINASGQSTDQLTAFDMMILNDLAYQQMLESRAAMELADNPQIQVKSYMGKDPNTKEPMYTYTLNNLVTFREKSAKMKMKYLNEMIATARAKSIENRAHMDKSSAAAESLRRSRDLLGDSAITRPEPETIDADFTVDERKSDS